MNTAGLEVPFNPFGNSRYLCPVVDPENRIPVWKTVQVVGVFTCKCWENCDCTSEFVAVQVVGTDTAAFRFPFSQLVRFNETLVDTPVLVR